MKSLFAWIVLMAAAGVHAQAPDPQGADPCRAVRFMIGDWTGEATGEPGKGAVQRQYAFILGDHFIEERNTSTYASRDGKPAEVHEHRAIFSYDRARSALMLHQFHEESFVNLYAMNPAQSTASRLVFDSVSFENFGDEWRARETYDIVSPDEFIETFELKQPGRKDYQVYSRNHFKRKAAPVRTPPPARLCLAFNTQ
jgi:hypothetical protein